MAPGTDSCAASAFEKVDESQNGSGDRARRNRTTLVGNHWDAKPGLGEYQDACVVHQAIHSDRSNFGESLDRVLVVPADRGFPGG
jgi:hypothetical protein